MNTLELEIIDFKYKEIKYIRKLLRNFVPKMTC